MLTEVLRNAKLLLGNALLIGGMAAAQKREWRAVLRKFSVQLVMTVTLFVGSHSCHVKVIDTAAAKGDPHLQNILGQKFDLMMPGLHTLLKIPRRELDASAKLKLLISADAERVQEDASCGELSFQTINLSS